VDIKAPTREERTANHIKGIKIVLATSILGIIAGIISSPYFLSPENANFALFIVVLFIYAQKFLLPVIGVSSKNFGFKDWFFISFMTLSFWFVTWTLILNGPAPAFGPFF
jgi:hypothetical protein